MNDMSNAPMRYAMNSRAEGMAFLKLSQTQRRISWNYRRWALTELHINGKTARYEKWAAEARTLWSGAKYHLEVARRKLHG